MTTLKQWEQYQAKARATLVAELERQGTQRALAKRIGRVSVPFVNMMLKGKRPVSAKVAKRLGLTPLQQPKITPASTPGLKNGTWWAVIPPADAPASVAVWTSRAAAVAHKRAGDRVRRVVITWEHGEPQ